MLVSFSNTHRDNLKDNYCVKKQPGHNYIYLMYAEGYRHIDIV